MIRDARGQSTVVGVALLLGVTLVALATVTASLGVVVESNQEAAAVSQASADLDRTVRPVQATGPRSGTVHLGGGSLRSVGRDLRLLNDSGVVRTVRVDALVYRRGDARVAVQSGGIVRGTGDGARFVRDPPVSASRGAGGVLVVGAARLGGRVDVGGAGSVRLATNVSHDRVRLGDDRYRVAVETTTPAAWVAFFEARGATIEATDRDLDNDGVPSVVARFPGTRTAYLVVHDLRLEVADA